MLFTKIDNRPDSAWARGHRLLTQFTNGQPSISQAACIYQMLTGLAILTLGTSSRHGIFNWPNNNINNSSIWLRCELHCTAFVLLVHVTITETLLRSPVENMSRGLDMWSEFLYEGD